MMETIVVYGAGGHAKVVVEAVLTATPDRHVVLIDDDPEALGKEVLGIAVAGGRDCLLSQFSDAPVALGIGGNSARSRLMEWLANGGRRLATVIHPSATVSPSAKIGEGCFIAAGAIVIAEAELGRGVVVNTGASIDHDCVINDGAHIGPGARLCGNVSVGARTLVGVGAAVCPGVSIGEDVIVGAGSAVTRDLHSGGRFAGCPARPIS